MSLTDAMKKLFSKKEPRAGTEDAPIPAEEAAGAEQEKAPGRWAGDMIPRVTGRGKSVERSGGGGYMSCATVRLEWVSRETDAAGDPLRVRTPKGRALTVPEVGFVAAGRLYASRDQLTVRKVKDTPWAKDVYGRDVLVLTERFPCFDSSDYLYEKRHFRWYFLCRDGALTCVYHTDNTPFVTVTEDVLDLEEQCWEKMEKLGCFR